MTKIGFAVAALGFSTHIACAAMTEDEFSDMADGLSMPCNALVAIANGKLRGNFQTLNPIVDWLVSLPYGWNANQALGYIEVECRRNPKFVVVSAVDRLLYDNRTHHLPHVAAH